MKRRNMIAIIPVEYDLKTIKQVNDNFLREEALNEQYDLLQSLEEDFLNGNLDSNEWNRIKDNTFIDDACSQPECYLFMQIRSAIKTNSFDTPIERKVLRKGKLYYKYAEDSNDLYEDSPTYYLLLTYYKYSRYALAEIVIETSDNKYAEEITLDILDIITSKHLSLDNYGEINIYNKDKISFNDIFNELGLNVIIDSENYLLYNGSKNEDIINHNYIKKVIYPIYQENCLEKNIDIKNYLVKGINGFDVYLLSNTLLINSIENDSNGQRRNVCRNYSDAIEYLYGGALGEGFNKDPLNKFELLAYVYYEFTILRNVVIKQLIVDLEYKLDHDQYEEELVDFQVKYARLIRLWDLYSNTLMDKTFIETIESEFKIKNKKNYFIELYRQVIEIKETKSEIKAKNLAKKLNIFQTISLIAILAGWLLEIIKDKFIPELSNLYLLSVIVLFIIICIGGYLIYLQLDKRK